MKRATLFFTLFILCTSMVVATTFTLGEQEETISISPDQDVGKTIVIIDNNQTASFDSLKANELQLLPITPGEHTIEIRYVKTVSYEWERPDITKNDEPELNYVEYDKDDKKVEFSIQGENMIHPNDLSYGESVQNMLEEYTVVLNNYTTLEKCYPRVTTGKNLFFSCKANEYARLIQVTFPIGITQHENITVKETITESVNEELLLEEQIELKDTIKTNSGHIPVTVFIILMFLSFMTILFVASHHNYESKKAGTHHNVKKK